MSERIRLDDLAAELGIRQTPQQPLPPADVLREFDYTIPRDAEDVSKEDANIIRNAWEEMRQQIEDGN
jgi:hypothetical protein